MPRKSFVPGAALVAAAALTVGLAGCTGGSSTDDDAADAKAGGASSSSQAAEPGRYQTLPEACGLPARGTVRGMLPGDGRQPSQAEAEKIYGGEADITYDTDRRVGCRWKRETAAGTRHLSLDIQRVVSYDAAVSDDDKAQEIYADKELAADIPSGDAGSTAPTSPPASPSATNSKGAGTGKATGAADGAGAGKGSAAGKAPDDAGKTSADPSTSSDTSTAPDSSIAPRVLDDLGDAAFLNDKLITADSGVHRDVTVVFRTSNVIVTIGYDQWSTDKSMLPESQELQDRARSLAGELVERFNE
ncbi:hypothetical protein QOM21_19545 [Streptomyces sp. Pv4-95]|uniref:hypothetical protein n=1 Tax=Streptomyces sp. Pv4-95 TaxID=3049543 RepID=UPI003891F81B